MNELELRNDLRDICEKAGSVMAWSKKHKISHSYVSAFLRGDRPAGDKILKCLKRKKVVRYLVKGQTVVMRFEDI